MLHPSSSPPPPSGKLRDLFHDGVIGTFIGGEWTREGVAGGVLKEVVEGVAGGVRRGMSRLMDGVLCGIFTF